MKNILLALSAVALATAPVPGHADPAQVERGRAAYESKGCYECHGWAGQGSIMSGPPLTVSPLPFAAMEAYVRAPKGQMPPYSARILAVSDLQDIHAFVDSLGSQAAARPTAATAGPPQGAALYAANCAACHAADGSGRLGPSLIGAATRLGPGGVARVVMHPPGAMPKLHPQPLGDDDVKAIAAYVDTLK